MSGASPEAQHLIEQHRGYARSLALQIAGHRSMAGCDRDDMIANAYLGLTQAAGAFDPMAGASFETFAYSRIRGAVFDGLRKSSGLPRRSRRHAQVEEAMDSVAEAAARDATDSNEAAARAFREAIRGMAVVHRAAGLGPDGTLGAAEPSSDDDPGEAIDRHETRWRVREAIDSLPTEASELINSLYIEGRSMSDLAGDLGVNKSTISRMHAKAIRLLQDALGSG